MKKNIIRLNESDLERLVMKIIKEEKELSEEYLGDVIDMTEDYIEELEFEYGDTLTIEEMAEKWMEYILSYHKIIDASNEELYQALLDHLNNIYM